MWEVWDSWLWQPVRSTCVDDDGRNNMWCAWDILCYVTKINRFTDNFSLHVFATQSVPRPFYFPQCQKSQTDDSDTSYFPRVLNHRWDSECMTLTSLTITGRANNVLLPTNITITDLVQNVLTSTCLVITGWTQNRLLPVRSFSLVQEEMSTMRRLKILK